MAQYTLAQLMDARNAVSCCPDTELKEIVLEVFRLLDYRPGLRQLVRRDLDLAATAEKKLRLIASAEQSAATPALEGLFSPGVEEIEASAVESLRLKEGRPRTLDGEAILLLAMTRAHLDSVSSRQALDRIRDSLVMNAYFEARSLSMPSRSVMHRWVNCISEQTYEHILETHLRMVMDEELDDMERVTADSFSVWADTKWPTDSSMILGLLCRAWHCADRLSDLGLQSFCQGYITVWLDRIRQFDRDISFACGKPGSKRKIRRLYIKLCNRADLLLQRLNRQLPELLPAWAEGIAALPFFDRRTAEALFDRLTSDLDDAAKVVAYARERILEGRSVPSSEKILSLSDRSAAYIKKGGREVVIGYKPQLMRSCNGFVTAFELQTGNPADAVRLLPLTFQHMLHTEVTPGEVSVDDGYSSRLNRLALEALGVRTISMNGAKGKRITPEDQWSSPAYEEARDKRSAVESLVFTMRFKFHLHRFSRRGIDAVTSEMYEKVIAHNLWRAALLRKRAAAAAPVSRPEAA